MNKFYFSFLLLLLIQFKVVAGANDSTRLDAVQKQMQSVKTSNDSLIKAVDTITDSLKKVSNILKGQAIVDLNYLDSVKKYPLSLLYDKPIYSKQHQKFGNWLTAAIAAILLIVMWYKGAGYFLHDNLCRDVCYDKNGNLKTDVSTIPYSYSRVQLFWWSMIILSCYIIFFGITGRLLPLNPTSVLLLGCGVIVTVGGKIIDNRQINSNGYGNRHQDNPDNGTPERKADLFRDILSDDNGISMHRFQAVVFNLVFGVAYISAFVTGLHLQQYPLTDFTEWQFALIGISSAGYLALKANENDKDVRERIDSTENPANNQNDDSNSAQHDR